MSVLKDISLQQQLERYGFIHIPFLSVEQVSKLKQIYADLSLDFREGFHSTMHQQNVELRRKADEAIRQVLTGPLQEILVGYKILFANYVVKEANSASEVGVHQDWNYIEENGQISVNTWIPLVDTTAENGVLYVLPGSHLLKTPARYTPFENFAYSGLNKEIQEQSIPIPSKAGDLILYDTRLIHFSYPNKSNAARPAINSINIPSNATPIHYWREPEAEQLSCYEVDEDFFNTHVLNQVPKGYPLAKWIDRQTEYFSLTDLEKLDSLIEEIWQTAKK